MFFPTRRASLDTGAPENLLKRPSEPLPEITDLDGSNGSDDNLATSSADDGQKFTEKHEFEVGGMFFLFPHKLKASLREKITLWHIIPG